MPLLRSSRPLTFALLSPPRTAVPLAAQTWLVPVSDESSLYPGSARYSAAVGGRAGKDSVARLKGRLSASSPPRRRPPRTPRSVHTVDWAQVFCNTLGASFLARSLPRKRLQADGFRAKTQNVIRYLQTNQVLATLAFSYKIQYHAPLDSLHTFADAMEAFIESLFSSDIWHNNLAALEWLVTLWSPTCFPLLQADLAAYDPPPGVYPSPSASDRRAILSLADL